MILQLFNTVMILAFISAGKPIFGRRFINAGISVWKRRDRVLPTECFYEEAFNTEFRELHPKLMSRRRDLREILIVGKDWFRENPPPADYKESWIDGLVENDEEDEEDEGED
ncbi:hypothetical protein FCM35_KLT18356 [Carex littledalei]|uniref:Uncharacterized protein n=1 Tax=Carex littledalei TaxID=544730 RepID=A0A833VYR3_9POAL|nr:hypothetical protein FCM35_KLT18356 [Carex littledalei]